MTNKAIIRQVKYYGTKDISAYGNTCKRSAVVCIILALILLAVLQAVTFFVASKAGYSMHETVILCAVPFAGPMFATFQMLLADVGQPLTLAALELPVVLLFVFAANRRDNYKRVVYAVTYNPHVAPPVTRSARRNSKGTRVQPRQEAPEELISSVDLSQIMQGAAKQRRTSDDGEPSPSPVINGEENAVPDSQPARVAQSYQDRHAVRQPAGHTRPQRIEKPYNNTHRRVVPLVSPAPDGERFVIGTRQILPDEQPSAAEPPQVSNSVSAHSEPARKTNPDQVGKQLDEVLSLLKKYEDKR